ncbi:MAG: endonuclease V [Chloroflexi bacterium]|nr:endonuclease V [Chloroflexota bacterium]
MKSRNLHTWDLSIDQAKELQRDLAFRVSVVSEDLNPRYVAGVDISAPDASGVARGAAVVLSYPGLVIADYFVTRARVSFPYVPGLLSFREAPLVIQALEGLSIDPDLILVDGQGLAHPRRFGLACHIGLLMDVPTIGCAKSRLCGVHAAPGAERGSYSYLTDGEEVIGAVLRTKPRTNPIFVSVGHRIDLETAIIAHPGVLEAAVIAIPHERWGERPLACVVPHAEFQGKLQKAEVLDFIRDRFASWWMPDDVVFIDEIPKTSVGKFDKKVLRERYKDYQAGS